MGKRRPSRPRTASNRSRTVSDSGGSRRTGRNGAASRDNCPAPTGSAHSSGSVAASAATCQATDHIGEPLAIDLDACQRAAAIFRALGDPQRLRILIMLEASERCVSEMSVLLEDSMPAISQRLRLLRSERIVRTRRDGKHVYYGLADEHISRLLTNALMHALEHANT